MNKSKLTLSIIVPVYNEEATIGKILQRLSKVRIPGVEKEIVVVDDGSSDKSREKIKKHIGAFAQAIFIQKDKNEGKGAAVIEGIKKANGQYIIIQDADLEYNPAQIQLLMRPVFSNTAEVVYGTRLDRLPNFNRDERHPLFLLHYIGNRFLSLVTSILYGQWITDMETCYKLFPKKAVSTMTLNARGFDFEPEITAKLIKKGYRIHEVPIKTTPRGYEEGKKLHTFRDGAKALHTLLRYRFLP